MTQLVLVGLCVFVNFIFGGAIRSSKDALDLDCDVDAEDQEMYGPKLQSKLCPKVIGCTFWDACRRLEDQSCPSFCRPWKEDGFTSC